VLSALQERAGRDQLVLGSQKGERYELWRSVKGKTLVTGEENPTDQILLPEGGFRRLSWWFLDERGQKWVSCNISTNPEEEAADPDRFWKYVENAKLIKLMVSMEEELSSSLLTEEQIPRAVRKYEQIKDLFELLKADVVRAWADHFRAGFTTERNDPKFDTQIFRFARQGPQFLLRPMEERRGRRAGESDEDIRIIGDGGTSNSPE